MALKDKQKSKRISNWIPTEILIEFFLKLPVKSLLRCKSVCKEWYSLISDQHFIKTHYTLSSTKPHYAHHRLVFIKVLGTNYLTNCPLHDVLFNNSINNALLLENPLQRTLYRGFRIVGSCNGLLCILVQDDNTLIIYNPSTRRTNILPGSKQGAISLFVSYGFGYDETTHDYKVVKMWLRDQTSRYWDPMIYSLKVGSWKKIGCFPCVYPENEGKYLNGALHWATGNSWSSGHIVSLDLGKETYNEVLQPKYAEGTKKWTLGVLGEWLCVLCHYYKNPVIDVWVMKVYGVKDSWTKLVSISHLNDLNLIPSMNFHDAPLCISNDGKLLLQLETKLVVYDCINSSYSEIQNFDGLPYACNVVESLISPFAPFGLGDNNGDEN